VPLVALTVVLVVLVVPVALVVLVMVVVVVRRTVLVHVVPAGTVAGGGEMFHEPTVNLPLQWKVKTRFDEEDP
jgi:hypothetical protein